MWPAQLFGRPVDVQLPVDFGARQPYLVDDLALHVWMADPHALTPYDQDSMLSICHPLSFTRSTHALESRTPDMPDDCVVSFFFFPGSDSHEHLPHNMCVDWMTNGHLGFHGDIIAVMHELWSGEVLDITSEEAGYVDALLSECVGLHSGPAVADVFPICLFAHL